MEQKNLFPNMHTTYFTRFKHGTCVLHDTNVLICSLALRRDQNKIFNLWNFSSLLTFIIKNFV